MKKKRLGVNVDHVATIRNARGEIYPDPLRAALTCQKSGADSITIHLREDRRHIKDLDLKKMRKKLNIPLNLEMAPTNEMIKIAKNETIESGFGSFQTVAVFIIINGSLDCILSKYRAVYFDRRK